MKIILTPQQKQQLEEMHDSTHDGRVRDRIKAVLLASEGWSQAMISQALRIHESTVARYLSDYVLSEKLKPENSGSQSRLSAGQTMQLIEHLTDKMHFHTHQIVAYVQAEFGIRYIVAGMNKWLHHHGFSFKKEHYPLEQKVHLILDDAAYHQSKLVKNTAKTLNIELHYLPPYSPNLNPIERLWKVMNEHVKNNVYFPSKAAFTSAIKKFFDVTLPEVAGSLVPKITDNFQILKPASLS